MRPDNPSSTQKICLQKQKFQYNLKISVLNTKPKGAPPPCNQEISSSSIPLGLFSRAILKIIPFTDSMWSFKAINQSQYLKIQDNTLDKESYTTPSSVSIYTLYSSYDHNPNGTKTTIRVDWSNDTTKP